MACCFIMLIEYLWFTLLYTIWYFYAFSLCIYTYIHIYIYHICMFFLRGVALGFGLRELHWLGRCSTTEPNSQPYFFLLVVLHVGSYIYAWNGQHGWQSSYTGSSLVTVMTGMLQYAQFFLLVEMRSHELFACAALQPSFPWSHE
jgi:hypothetical protein